MSLDNFRKEIDKIDDELFEILSRRKDVVIEVGKFKKENNLPIYHPEREAEVLKKKIKISFTREKLFRSSTHKYNTMTSTTYKWFG